MGYRHLLLIALAVAAPAIGKVRFAKYVGKPVILTGEGGMKIDNHGIDVWTSGRPDRPYEFLGTIDDDRQDRPFSGDALNSPSIAKKVREVGGDALILGPRNTQAAGVTTGNMIGVYGNYAFETGGGRIVHDVATTFAVIRYLPEK